MPEFKFHAQCSILMHCTVNMVHTQYSLVSVHGNLNDHLATSSWYHHAGAVTPQSSDAHIRKSFSTTIINTSGAD